MPKAKKKYITMIYKYKDLKEIIKVGDKVRAVPGEINPCDKLNSDGSNEGEITEVCDGYFCINGCSHTYSKFWFLDLNPRRIVTWENLQAGDKVKCGKDILTIKGNVGTIFFLTMKDEDVERWWSCMTAEEMEDVGYEIIQPEEKKEEVKELTMSDVEKLVGQKVKIVKE